MIRSQSMIALSLTLMLCRAASADELQLALPPLPDAPAVVTPADVGMASADHASPAAPQLGFVVPLPDEPLALIAQPEAGRAVTATAVPITEGHTAPAPTVAPADAKASLKTALETWASSSSALPAVRLHDRQAIAAFYATHDYTWVWMTADGPTVAARAAAERIARASEDGLDLRAFPATAADAHGVDAELAFAERVTAYGRQASGGRVEPRQISTLITQKPQTAEAAVILAAVAAANAQAGDVLQGFNPPRPEYAALRAKLAAWRARRSEDAPLPVPSGPPLRTGQSDARVPLLRARLGLPPIEAPADTLYTAQVAAAVADFQRTNGLPASGILTAQTAVALSGGDALDTENELLINMERWRWMPRERSASRIEVNVPDFTVKVTLDGATAHQARVVVGKPTTPTPIFSNTMQFLIINPYWNVPQSIIRKEMLPKLAADPSYLHRLGYEVLERNGQMIVRQPPGERNALGRIKFMFPNDHAVYLHDTPSRALFANTMRAYSHGCVRVDQPLKFAEIVLGRDQGWTEQRVRKMIGGDERTVHLPKPLPIDIEYFTAFVDDAGVLQLRDDIYGYSLRMKIAMGLAGDRIAMAPWHTPAEPPAPRLVRRQVSLAVAEPPAAPVSSSRFFGFPTGGLARPATAHEGFQH